MKIRILSTLLAFCMMLVLLPGTALATEVASGTCGQSANWTLDTSGTLTISGIGSTTNFGYDGVVTTHQPWEKYRADITKVVVNNGISRLGTEAFSGCSNLTSVNLPNSLAIIGSRAFSGCGNLSSITIPSSVTNIGSYVFNSCKNITKLTIPYGVVSLGDSVFYNCNRLVSVTLPATITSMGNSIFYGCSSLTSIVIPDSVTSLGSSIFYGCKALRTVTIPDSVVSVGTAVFYGCTSLTSITIPHDIGSISSSLFNGCTGLKSVTLPASITSIGDYAFNGCSKLTDIYFSGTEAQWSDITIGSYNSRLTAATKHYNSGDDDVSLTAPKLTLSSKSVTEGTPVTVSWDAVTDATNYYWEITNDETDDIQLETGYTEGRSIKIELPLTPGRYRVSVCAAVNSVKGPSNSVVFTVTKKATTKTYKITLNANGGKVSPSSLTVDSGKTYFSQLPTPTRSGYKFDGWYTTKTGSTRITSTTKATANRTIYAHWTRNRTYMVTFDPNGGMVYLDWKAVTTGVTYRELPTPTRPGYHFKGWYTKKASGTKVTETTRVNLTANQTLYAQWQTAAVTAKSTEKKAFTVTVPVYYELALYSTATGSKVSTTVETTSYQDIRCTQKVTLSNGTVRYYGKVNNKNYWFTYSCEMDVR